MIWHSRLTSETFEWLKICLLFIWRFIWLWLLNDRKLFPFLLSYICFANSPYPISIRNIFEHVIGNTSNKSTKGKYHTVYNRSPFQLSDVSAKLSMFQIYNKLFKPLNKNNLILRLQIKWIIYSNALLKTFAEQMSV